MAISNSAKQTYQGFLRALVRDERLGPSRKLLATMLLMYVEGMIPLTLVEDIWGNPKRIKWNSAAGTEPDQPESKDKNNEAARELLSELFGELKEDNAAVSSPENGNGEVRKDLDV